MEYVFVIYIGSNPAYVGGAAANVKLLRKYIML